MLRCGDGPQTGSQDQFAFLVPAGDGGQLKVGYFGDLFKHFRESFFRGQLGGDCPTGAGQGFGLQLHAFGFLLAGFESGRKVTGEDGDQEKHAQGQPFIGAVNIQGMPWLHEKPEEGKERDKGRKYGGGAAGVHAEEKNQQQIE